MKKLKLMVSRDLGQTYVVEKTAKLLVLKKFALKLDKNSACRWVIVDGCDDPKYWCGLIERPVHSAEAGGSTIATGDRYLKKVAAKRGVPVMDERFLFRSMGIDHRTVPKLDMNPQVLAKALDAVKDMVEKGMIGIAPSVAGDPKADKEDLFGDDR